MWLGWRRQGWSREGVVGVEEVGLEWRRCGWSGEGRVGVGM